MDDIKQIKTALQDVKIIKDMMQKSKFQLSMLAGLFLWYGALRLSQLIVSIVGHYFSALYFPVTQGTQLNPIFIILNYLVFIILFVVFINKRRIVKKSQNEYTLNLFDVWGFILFLIPGFQYLVLGIFSAFNLYQIDLVILAEKDFNTIVYVSMMMGLLITGILLKNNILKISSIALILVYPFVPLLLGPIVLGERRSLIYTTDIVYITTIHWYFSFLLQIITVIVLGIYFRQQAGGVRHGDQ